MLFDPADPRRADVAPTGAWSATAARAGRSSRRWRSCSRRRRRRRLHRRAARLAGAARRGRAHRAADGSTGGNMEGKEQRFGIADSALWAAVTTVTSCGAVNAAIESLTGIGGAVPMANLSTERGDLRRRRHGALLDARVRPPGGLHRRPDGRPHARVPRQEDRGARDQAGRRSALLFTPLVGADLDRARHREQVRDARRSSPAARRASPRPSTPTSRRRTTTAPRSPATPASSSPTPRATPAPTGSRSPTSWAGLRCCSRASRRSCSRSPSPARSPASGSSPPAPARCAPTRRPSWCC